MPSLTDSAGSRGTAVMAGALVTAAFLLAIDLRLPSGEGGGAAGGLLYLILLGFGWFLPRPRLILGLGLMACLFVVAGWFLSPAADVVWPVALNRCLAILLVWSLAGLMIAAKRAAAPQLADQDPSPVLRVTHDGGVLYANAAARACSDLFSSAPGARLCDRLRAEVANAAGDGAPKDVDLVANGRSYSLILAPDPAASYLNIYAWDVTERLRAEAVLTERVSELEDAQVGLEQQRAGLIHLTDDLKNAREQAEAASRAKSHFLAAVSHELRTPLNAILGFAEIIKGELIGPVGNKRYLSYAWDIYQSGDHLLSLINDILDISKVESGNMELNEEQIDLSDLIASVVRLIKQRAKENQLDLSVEIRDELPILYADERKLKQVLMNLLSNAVKFTEPGGTVALKAWHQTNSGFVFQVLDSGIGMAPQDIPKALSQFGQIDSDRNRKHNGTGLGLPLSKSLVEMHGGSLDLQSQLGVGTTATVRLPAARTAPLEIQPAAAAS